MLMKKFLGASAREAMQKMKAELGPDALVISNRKTAEGVEILAMVENAPPPPARQIEYAPQEMEESRAPASRRAAPARPQRSAAPGAERRDGAFTSLKDYAPRVAPPSSANPFAPPVADAYGAAAAAPSPAWPAPRPAPRPSSSARDPFAAPELQPAAPLASAAPTAWGAREPESERRLFDELAAMKSMLQNQMAGLAWRDMSERRPLAVKLWRELVEAGFSASLARAVADKLPDDLTEQQGRKWVADVLARNLRCADPARDMVESGGVYALVGPTGVGKTTTTAKLAARCVVKYGAQSLGLITTDSYRIGAFDQLSIYGKILGVPVHSAQSYGELESTIGTMSAKRLVLIDTTGMGQRDNRVGEQINLLNNPRIRRVLLLGAAAQAETLEDVARAYQGKAAGARPLSGAIITKVDEAAKLAPVLDIAARHALELQYVTNGQRVPEDLHAPVAAALVHRALKAAVDPVFALRDNEVAARAMPAAGLSQ